ncbi:DUF6525 family protein [Tritonibacter sp. SIMBA_163]|uniref:DUF6525 family protein n=1 Tax=Tritonibacter TaxID=2083206 RepID=UPI003980F9FF
MARRDRDGNRGAVSLPTRRRHEDPMAAYDRLPPPLRAWVREASLPWSAQSCRRIWQAARRAGLGEEAALAHLDAVEQKTLAQPRNR